MVNIKPTPTCSSQLLMRHTDFEAFYNSLNYRSVIGKLHYLDKFTKCEMIYSTYQYVRFSVDPKREHGAVMRRIGRYIKGTKTKVTILILDKSRGLEIYVDADYAGNSYLKESTIDIDPVRSRYGYTTPYNRCSIV